MYAYIIQYMSGHKWFTKHRVLKSYRSKMGIVYMQSWKQCALRVITTIVKLLTITHELYTKMFRDQKFQVSSCVSNLKKWFFFIYMEEVQAPFFLFEFNIKIFVQ